MCFHAQFTPIYKKYVFIVIRTPLGAGWYVAYGMGRILARILAVMENSSQSHHFIATNIYNVLESFHNISTFCVVFALRDQPLRKQHL
jgi:hypothetical protein